MVLIGIRNLCTPAYVYLVISVITILVIAIQNMGNYNVYCLGGQSCETNNKVTIFLVKIIYIILWTWLLNFLCNYDLQYISWLLVLLPYVLMFVLIGFLFISSIPDDGRYTDISSYSWAFF